MLQHSKDAVKIQHSQLIDAILLKIPTSLRIMEWDTLIQDYVAKQTCKNIQENIKKRKSMPGD